MPFHYLPSKLKTAIEDALYTDNDTYNMAGALSMDNPAFSALAFYSVLCILKMFFVTFRIVFLRLTRHVYSTQEDVKGFSNNPKGHPIYDDTEVERTRRSHQNDLENIPIFIFLGLLLVATGCNQQIALMHFRIFTGARILFTLCHLLAIPAPSRTICFVVGTLVNISMAVQVVMATM